MMFFGGPWMIIFWLVVIGLIVWGGIALTRRGDCSPKAIQKRDASVIAKVGYAKGKITKEELEEIKRRLV